MVFLVDEFGHTMYHEKAWHAANMLGKIEDLRKSVGLSRKSRRHFPLFILLICFTLSLFIGTAASKNLSKFFQLELQEHRLPNGLRLVLHPVPGGQVRMNLRYAVGEGDSATRGLAHLSEHLMFEGSKHAKNGAYDKLLASVGGTSNAWTSHDSTVFSAVFPPEALDLVLFLESDRMGWLCQGIDQGSLENQKLVVLQEYFSDTAGQTALHADLLRSAIYRGMPLEGQILGNMSDLDSITLSSVCKFSKRWYRPNNAILVLVGDFDPQQVIKKVEHWFSDIDSAMIPEKKKWEIPSPEKKYFYTHMKDITPLLYIGWPIVPQGHPDEAALDLLLDVLVHSKEGLLQRSGLKAYGWVENTRFGGMMVFRLQGKEHSLLKKKFWKVFKKIHHLRQKNIKPFQLRLYALYIRALGSLQHRATIATKCALYHRLSNCMEWDMKRRLELTPHDLQKVAQKYLSPQQAVYLSATKSVEFALPLAIPISLP